MLGFAHHQRPSLRTISKIVDCKIMTALTAPCVFTGEEYTTSFYPTDKITAGFRARENGALIQVAFPFMSLEDREFVLSGISPNGWNATVSDE